MKFTINLIALLLTPQVALRGAEESQPAGKPNILFILADDMGYGDPRCFNPQSKCATPNIDRLATQGMRFTDAHAAGSVKGLLVEWLSRVKSPYLETAKDRPLLATSAGRSIKGKNREHAGRPRSRGQAGAGP